jgi:hypothetical protein
MARSGPLLSEAQWKKIAPLLPKPRKHRPGGRPWIDNRRVLEGILWTLRSAASFDLLAAIAGLGGALARIRGERPLRSSPHLNLLGNVSGIGLSCRCFLLNRFKIRTGSRDRCANHESFTPGRGRRNACGETVMH